MEDFRRGVFFCFWLSTSEASRFIGNGNTLPEMGRVGKRRMQVCREVLVVENCTDSADRIWPHLCHSRLYASRSLSEYERQVAAGIKSGIMVP